MARNINLLRSIIKINLAQFFTYRTEFWLNLIDSLAWFFITISFYKYLYATSALVPGVSLKEIYLIVATSEIIKSLLFTFCINNLAAIPESVRDGTLDGLLLKPINSQVLISFRKINFGNLGSFFPAILLLFANSNVFSLSIINYVILVIFSFVLGYSLWFSLMTLSVWFVQLRELHELFLGILTLNQFPLSVFKVSGKLAYYLFLPVLLTSNMPVLGMLKKSNIALISGYILFSIGMCIFSSIFWKLSIRYYSSASN